jgi:hypothetical protein
MKGEGKLQIIPAHFHFGTEPVACSQMVRTNEYSLAIQKVIGMFQRAIGRR